MNVINRLSAKRGYTSGGWLLAVLLVSANTQAADNWNVDGEHGELRVHGRLLEGACRLDMTSVFQQVDLGPIAGNVLSRPGDEGQPVRFQITLRDCSRSGGEQSDRYSGNSSWDAIQPVVTLSFEGVTDAALPTLLKTNGVTGLALRLRDPQGRTLQPGQRGEPLIITPGDNVLNYTVAPVRTPEPLTNGAFSALTRFKVSYD